LPFVASGFDDQTPEHRIDLIVGKYLTNVRDGLMDATGALYDLEDDDPLAVSEEEDGDAASRTFSTS
jgi:hypothetical protein